MSDRPGYSIERIRSSRSTLLVIAAAVVTLVGSFTTWASVGPFTVSGMDGDGTITLIVAVIAVLAAMILMDRGRARMIALFVMGALIVAIAIIDIADVSKFGDDFGGVVDVSVGFGLWLVLVGGLGTIVGAFLKD